MHVRRDLQFIAVGGMAGAALRWFISREEALGDGGWFSYRASPSGALMNFEPEFPTSTLIVNLFGCLLLGALTVLLTQKPDAHRRRFLIGAATGFCGSLTTFSTFAVEVAELLGAHYPPERGLAVVYVAASVFGGAAAFAIGRSASRTLTT